MTVVFVVVTAVGDNTQGEENPKFTVIEFFNAQGVQGASMAAGEEIKAESRLVVRQDYRFCKCMTREGHACKGISRRRK